MKKIEQFIKGIDYKSFCKDEKTYFAVIRAIEIIGEATKNIPETIRSNYPDIPWKEMAGMRDKLIHRYFGVDFKIVWETITEILPKIKPLMEKVLNDINKTHS